MNDMNRRQELQYDGYSLFNSEQQMNEAVYRISKVVSEKILADIK